MQFSPIAALPGWEATEGSFRLCGCVHLRFLRYVRKVGDRVALAIVTETPREFDRLIERTAARTPVAKAPLTGEAA